MLELHESAATARKLTVTTFLRMGVSITNFGQRVATVSLRERKHLLDELLGHSQFRSLPTLPLIDMQTNSLLHLLKALGQQ
jgi:hypothetical protein